MNKKLLLIASCAIALSQATTCSQPTPAPQQPTNPVVQTAPQQPVVIAAPSSTPQEPNSAKEKKPAACINNKYWVGSLVVAAMLGPVKTVGGLLLWGAITHSEEIAAFVDEFNKEHAKIEKQPVNKKP
jgi:hypothetical protein